jgi:site-specific recombinase XerD
VLSVYRRHREKCPHADDRISRKCRCALWAKGTIEGKPYQKSLKTRNFERAEQLARKIENGVQAKQQPKGITTKEALAAFIKDCEGRNLSRNTLRKYQTLESTLNTFGQDHGIVRCQDFTSDSVRDFRSSRRLASLTSSKELGHLRTFFQFCIDRGWLTKNPAKSIKAPQVKINPRLPFSEKEIQNILSEAEDDRELSFILTLRHTGLRIGDASLLKTSQLADNRIYLYTTKAGTPVSILIPETLVSLLKKLPPKGGHFFLRGESTHPHTASDLWRKRIKAICKEVGIAPDHPHRFRHSLAADLLSKGVSVENVAAILGNSPAIVQKHYSQWISSRQDALDAALQSTWKLALQVVKNK